MGRCKDVPVPTERRFVLTFACPDSIGIVARINYVPRGRGRLIVEAAYHTDQETGRFFTRQVIHADTLIIDIDELRLRFGADRRRAGAQEPLWKIIDTEVRRRVVLLVRRSGTACTTCSDGSRRASCTCDCPR